MRSSILKRTKYVTKNESNEHGSKTKLKTEKKNVLRNMCAVLAISYTTIQNPKVTN